MCAVSSLPVVAVATVTVTICRTEGWEASEGWQPGREDPVTRRDFERAPGSAWDMPGDARAAGVPSPAAGTAMGAQPEPPLEDAGSTATGATRSLACWSSWRRCVPVARDLTTFGGFGRLPFGGLGGLPFNGLSIGAPILGGLADISSRFTPRSVPVWPPCPLRPCASARPSCPERSTAAPTAADDGSACAPSALSSSHKPHPAAAAAAADRTRRGSRVIPPARPGQCGPYGRGTSASLARAGDQSLSLFPFASQAGGPDNGAGLGAGNPLFTTASGFPSTVTPCAAGHRPALANVPLRAQLSRLPATSSA